MTRSVSTSLLLLLALLGTAVAQQKPEVDKDPARTFFQKGAIVRVHIKLEPAERQKLREKARVYAAASLQLDGDDMGKVAIKLKGAAGSFREIDDRPGFTVHLGKLGGEHRLHGLQRFHLNNGAQDESRLCEWLGHEVFAAAQYPAPRVAHAHVWLDGQDLGVYVLRESFDKQFLLRAFGSSAGNLYDGGFCQDIDQNLEKDSGDGPDDHADLKALRELCADVDGKREDPLAAAIDIVAFVDFAALESMLQHWDGYTRNANNFRLWMPTGGKLSFLPHGMDQLFGDSDASVLDHPPTIVASAVMQQPTFRKRYRERLRALLPMFAPARWQPRLEAMADKLQKELRTISADAVRSHADAVRDLEARLMARYQSLERQVKAPEPKPLPLAIGKSVPLKAWNPAAETDRVELAKKSFQGVTALHVHCLDRGDEPRRGIWRTHVLLGKGRYQLRGIARCEGIVPPAKDGDGNEHGGAVLRVDGSTSERLHGDRNWQALVCDFEVGEFQRSVELACDVQAFLGRAWFRFDSLQLARLPD